MRVLVLAPHPFYQERGTPIAVDLLLRALSERGDEVDLLTFHEGNDRTYDRLRIHRIKPVLRVSNIRPGLSWKKLACDFHLFFKFVSLMRRNRYDLVHAVEEAAFMAFLVRPFFSTPYVYDMDSSMTSQIVDKYPVLKPLKGFLRFIESWPFYLDFVEFTVVHEAACPAVGQGNLPSRRIERRQTCVIEHADINRQRSRPEHINHFCHKAGRAGCS